jgi:hypothetical protein
METGFIVIDDLSGIQRQLMENATNAPKQIAERRSEPHVTRFGDQPDQYMLILAETDVMFIEDGLTRICENLRDDLNKVNFGTQSPRKVKMSDGGERTAEWSDEDAMFLGDSLHRLSSILFQTRFLRNNPTHTEAL